MVLLPIGLMAFCKRGIVETHSALTNVVIVGHMFQNGTRAVPVQFSADIFLLDKESKFLFLIIIISTKCSFR